MVLSPTLWNIDRREVQMRRVIAIALAANLVPAVVTARDLRVATWNLGWHLSQGEAQVWIDRCSSPFTFNASASRWEPASTGTPGWELRWGATPPPVGPLRPAALRRVPGELSHCARDR